MSIWGSTNGIAILMKINNEMIDSIIDRVDDGEINMDVWVIEYVVSDLVHTIK